MSPAEDHLDLDRTREYFRLFDRESRKLHESLHRRSYGFDRRASASVDW